MLQLLGGAVPLPHRLSGRMLQSIIAHEARAMGNIYPSHLA